MLGPDRLAPLDLSAYFCTVYEAIWKIRGPCAVMRRHCQRWQEALAWQDETVRDRVRLGLQNHPTPFVAWFKCLLKRGRAALGIRQAGAAGQRPEAHAMALQDATGLCEMGK
jgi:hypothetical protein